jgi:hypothetical protein
MPYQLTLKEALSKSSIPEYNRDFIENFLIKNYSNADNVKVYLTSFEQEKLIVIEYCLDIIFLEKAYKVYILIYLPSLFPYYEPEIYMKNKEYVGINDYYSKKTKKINDKTLRLSIKEFCPFDPEKNNIQEIINKIVEEFLQNFPIFKDKSKKNEDKVGKCNLDMSKSNPIIIPKYNNSYNKDNSNYFKNKISDSIYYKNSNSFNDESFLAFIRNQAKDLLRAKYMEFKEKYKFEGYESNLQNMKNITSLNLNKTNANLYSSTLIEEKNKLRYILDQFKIKENQISNEIRQNSQKDFFQKIDTLIHLKDPKDYNLAIKKKIIEDYLVYLKKGFEKEVVPLNEMINKTRSLSREIFSIDYLRKKNKDKDYKI